MKFELNDLLLNRKWKWVAITFFPLPFIILLLSVFLPYNFPQESVVDLFYLCWAIGFGLLNFTKQKEEDEMMEQLRLRSFVLGVYYLLWGLSAIAIFQIVSRGTIFTDYMSAYLAIWALNTYIFLSFKYFKWKNS